jgi:hypothetical protein
MPCQGVLVYDAAWIFVHHALVDPSKSIRFTTIEQAIKETSLHAVSREETTISLSLCPVCMLPFRAGGHSPRHSRTNSTSKSPGSHFHCTLLINYYFELL